MDLTHGRFEPVAFAPERGTLIVTAAAGAQVSEGALLGRIEKQEA